MAPSHAPELAICALLGLAVVDAFAPAAAPLALRSASKGLSLGRPRAARAVSGKAAALPKMQFGLGNIFGKSETPEEAKIIPDLLPAGTSIGSTKLRVKYPNWVKSAADLSNPFSLGDTPTKGAGEINLGQAITPTQAQSKPVIGWEAEKGAYYTLMLVDADYSSDKDPSKRNFVHWVRVNIPGDNLPCDGKDGGDDLKEYVGSGPAKDTGLHRYVFLLFKQAQEKQDFPNSERVPFTAKERSGFSVTDFAEKYELGSPVGWTYFKAEFDNYVPELIARLKGEIK